MYQGRHRILLEGRPEARPGETKTVPNRAGETLFVAPELVRGTLRQGFEMARSLAHPFARAAFLMFLVAEVHPFDDGNGRLARATMNGELVAGGQRRILVPIVYREDYLLALRALSRQSLASPLVRMLDYAQELAARVDFTDLASARGTLERANAFRDPQEALLRLPERQPPGR